MTAVCRGFEERPRLSFASWKEGRVVPAIVEMPVVDGESKKGPKP